MSTSGRSARILKKLGIDINRGKSQKNVAKPKNKIKSTRENSPKLIHDSEKENGKNQRGLKLDRDRVKRNLLVEINREVLQNDEESDLQVVADVLRLNDERLQELSGSVCTTVEEQRTFEGNDVNREILQNDEEIDSQVVDDVLHLNNERLQELSGSVCTTPVNNEEQRIFEGNDERLQELSGAVSTSLVYTEEQRTFEGNDVNREILQNDEESDSQVVGDVLHLNNERLQELSGSVCTTPVNNEEQRIFEGNDERLQELSGAVSTSLVYTEEQRTFEGNDVNREILHNDEESDSQVVGDVLHLNNERLQELSGSVCTTPFNNEKQRTFEGNDNNAEAASNLGSAFGYLEEDCLIELNLDETLQFLLKDADISPDEIEQPLESESIHALDPPTTYSESSFVNTPVTTNVEATLTVLSGTPQQKLMEIVGSSTPQEDLENDKNSKDGRRPPAKKQLYCDTFDQNVAHSSTQGLNSLIEDLQCDGEEEEEEEDHLEPYCPKVLKGTKNRKKQFCEFCDKDVYDFARHLRRNHKGLKAVKEFLEFPPGHPRRKQLIGSIRTGGNFIFNNDDLNTSFIPKRRPLKEQSPKKGNYTSCTYCFTLVTRKLFYKHLKTCQLYSGNLKRCDFCNMEVREGHLQKHLKAVCEKNIKACIFCNEEMRSGLLAEHLKKYCTEKKGEVPVKPKDFVVRKRVLREASVFAQPVAPGASDDLKRNVIPTIREDEKGKFLRKDSLILTIGSRLREKHREPHAVNNVSSHMRDLAHLVLTAQADKSQKSNENDQEGSEEKKDKVTCLADLLKAENSDLLMTSLQKASKLDEQSGKVGVPSMPSRLSPSIHEGFTILKNLVRKNPNLTYEVKKRKIFDLESSEGLFSADFSSKISTNADKTRKDHVANKDKTLPTRMDVKKSCAYLDKEMAELHDKLIKRKTKANYRALSRNLIANIIISNGRRSGETARTPLEKYLNRPQIVRDQYYESMLTTRELAAGDELTMFYVPAKRGKTVNIFLTPAMKRSVDLLLTLRAAFNLQDNPLLFPQFSSSRWYYATGIIEEYRDKFELSNKARFTARNLRKELASNSQVADRDPLQRTYLIDHMGHTKGVHENEYEVSMPVMQKHKTGVHLLDRRAMPSVPSGSGETGSVPSVDQLVDSGVAEKDIEEDPDYVPEQPEELVPSGSGETGSVPSVDQLVDSGVAEKDIEEDPDYVPEQPEELAEACYAYEPAPKKARRTNNPWTLEGQEIVLRAFSHYLPTRSTPGEQLCRKLMAENPVLSDRKWDTIKGLIENIKRGRKKVPPSLKHLVPKDWELAN